MSNQFFMLLKPPIDLSTYYNLKNHLQNFLNTLFFTTHDIFIIIYVFCAILYKRNCMILKSNDVNPKIQFSPSFTVKLQLPVNIFISLFLLLLCQEFCIIIWTILFELNRMPYFILELRKPRFPCLIFFFQNDK